jgi:hypothetical protein
MSWKISTRGIPQSITGVAPTLDYRFAIDRNEIDAISLTDKLTFTGGNEGTFVGSDGFIQRATTNVPRFDHDPVSRQSLGLLSEVERTNSLSNSTALGAVAGSPGTAPTGWFVTTDVNGLSRQIIGTGTEIGINYIDIRYSGTATSAGTLSIIASPVNTIVAENGQTWTGSAFVKLQAGTLANITNARHSINGRASNGANVEAVNIGYTPTGSQLIEQRRTIGIELASASSVRISSTVFAGDYALNAIVDFTLRIGLPQLEQGAFATSVIPTTSAAVTRTADSAVIDGTGVITGTYTLVEKPAGCAVVSGSNIELQPGFRAERIAVFPAALTGDQITAVRAAM